MDLSDPILYGAVVCDMDVVVKATGRDRIISLEASNEHQDSEGDSICQKALLEAADHFLQKGHLDLEHLSETGSRYGLDPQDYVVGRPLEVVDLGGGRTGVVGELNNSRHGDRIYKSLMQNPPETWRASIYGYPRGVDGISKSTEPGGRFRVTSLLWSSLAICKRPVNDHITGYARLVGADAVVKAQLDMGSLPEEVVAAIRKTQDLAPPVSASPASEDFSPLMLPPRNRFERLAHHDLHMVDGRSPCPHCGPGSMLGHSVAGFRSHFQGCCGLPYDDADVHALALAHQLKHR